MLRDGVHPERKAASRVSKELEKRFGQVNVEGMHLQRPRDLAEPEARRKLTKSRDACSDYRGYRAQPCMLSTHYPRGVGAEPWPLTALLLLVCPAGTSRLQHFHAEACLWSFPSLSTCLLFQQRL